MCQAVFSICFAMDEKDKSNLHVPERGGEELWVGCRDGYIYKLNGGTDVEVDNFNVSSFEIRRNDEIEDLMQTDQNANVNKISVTCHKRMEWDDCKIIIVGFSDGTLKVFDANGRDKKTGAALCTYSIQLCRNAITRIDEIKIGCPEKEETKKDPDFLNIDEDGSFDWLFSDWTFQKLTTKNLANDNENELDDHFSNLENCLQTLKADKL